jgi:hypothetical protein
MRGPRVRLPAGASIFAAFWRLRSVFVRSCVRFFGLGIRLVQSEARRFWSSEVNKLLIVLAIPHYRSARSRELSAEDSGYPAAFSSYPPRTASFDGMSLS